MSAAMPWVELPPAVALKRVGSAVFAIVLFLCGTISGVLAASHDRLPINNIALLQYLLIWTGDYVGIVDGVRGPLTETAFRQYLARSLLEPKRDGQRPTDDPGSDDALIRDAVEAHLMFDFALFRDGEIDAVYGVPRSLFEPPRPINRRNTVGLAFRSPDGAIELEVMRLTGHQLSLASLYRRLSRTQKRNVTYHVFKDDWFVISGTEASRDFYERFHRAGGQIRGFTFSYDQRWSADLVRIAVAMSNVFRATARANDPLIAFVEGLQAEMEAAASDERTQDRPSTSNESSGSGFVVDPWGHIVSNAHVVDRCRTIVVGESGRGKIMAIDRENDLALLLTSAARRMIPIAFRNDAIKLGEEVVAGGYPLKGVLADSLNITVGVVSSLSGPGNDNRFIQTTAAIQPGNSGGPLVDRHARVVGIVTAKFPAQEMLAQTGFVPEGVNFAIRHGEVRRFLEAHDIEPTVLLATPETRSVEEVAEVLENSVVPIVCLVN